MHRFSILCKYNISHVGPKGPLWEGDSPQCGEMSRSDRGARARRAPPIGGGGESLRFSRQYRNCLSLRPFGPPPSQREAFNFKYTAGGQVFLHGSSILCKYNISHVGPKGPLWEGDSPQCGEMSRSDRGARARRAPPIGGGGESLRFSRQYRNCLSLRPFGPPPSQREAFNNLL